MSGRTIAIGDIHGCNEALRAVLAAIDPQPADTIVTLGDYIDRGPDSRDVATQLLILREECELVTLLGNHELMLLIARDDPRQFDWWLECGGAATLLSYQVESNQVAVEEQNQDQAETEGEIANAEEADCDIEPSQLVNLDSIPKSHLDFFEACCLAYETETHIFVHANYDAKLPMDQQNDEVLLWHHLASHQPPEPHLSGKQVVVGHTPQFSGEVLDLGHLICIDTFCFGDGWLTALDVESKQVWQANKAGELRTQGSDTNS